MMMISDIAKAVPTYPLISPNSGICSLRLSIRSTNIVMPVKMHIRSKALGIVTFFRLFAIIQIFYCNYLCCFMAVTILSVRLSDRSLLSDMIAHITAGIQPISVICKIRQRMPAKIFPRNRKESQGRRTAINVM